MPRRLLSLSLLSFRSVDLFDGDKTKSSEPDGLVACRFCRSGAGACSSSFSSSPVSSAWLSAITAAGRC